MRRLPLLALLLVPACNFAPPTAPTAEDKVAKICAHKWWKVPPTAKRVEEYVEKMQATNRGFLCWIDRNGQFDQSKFAVPQATDTIPPNLDFNKPFLAYHAKGDVRPDRDELLDWLLGALDSAEFRDGAGR